MEYVKSHPEEFDAEAAVYDSPAYWEAVKQKYQRVIERTQPNYTAMQRTGFQRTKNQMAKTLMMFSTQRQQNAQILVSALEDAAAQAARYKADPSAANKEALETAKTRRADAISSQIVQTALIAGLGVGVKLLFHKWGDLQDENGDMTVWSLLSNFIYQFFNSGVSNLTGGSEAWRATETVMTGQSFGSYDTISMTGFSAVNDMTKSIAKLNGLLDKDTSEMTEEEFAEYEKSVRWAWADAVGQLAMLEGVPYNNVKKYVKAVNEWMDSCKKWKEEGKVSFDSAPSSATGQYDRLYNAIQSGDSEEAAAAMKKLEQMNKTDKVDSELARRLKKYDADILEAAKAQNAGKEKAAKTARQAAFKKLLDGLDVGSTDSARRSGAGQRSDRRCEREGHRAAAGRKGPGQGRQRVRRPAGGSGDRPGGGRAGGDRPAADRRQEEKQHQEQDHGGREGGVSGRKRPGPGEAGEEAAGPRGRRREPAVRGKELYPVGKRCGQEGREGKGREELVG